VIFAMTEIDKFLSRVLAYILLDHSIMLVCIHFKWWLLCWSIFFVKI